MNHSARHSYYVRKFIAYLAGKGYTAEKVEFTGMVGKQYTKRDLWGADIIFRGMNALGFVQVKTSAEQISKGRRQLSADTNWPPNIYRLVGYWPPRGKEPFWYEVPAWKVVQGLPWDWQELQGRLGEDIREEAEEILPASTVAPVV